MDLIPITVKTEKYEKHEELVFTIEHLDENPPSITIHWVEEDPDGSFVSEDGKRWNIIKTHYRKPNLKKENE